ncbi:MAG: GntP family permease, partial [Planctomycetaceae bacterium]
MDSTTTTLLVLAAGIVVVVGGVLVFRLHAFLALVLGACVVAALTPSDSVKTYAMARDGFRIVSAADYETVYLVKDGKRVDVEGATGWVLPGQVLLRLRKGQSADPNIVCRVYDRDAGELKSETLLIVKAVRKADRKNGVENTVASAELFDDAKIEALRTGRLAVPLPVVRAAKELSKKAFVSRVTFGFGSTCGKIGVLIALASIIGMCLLESGAADRIVRSTLKFFGERGAPASFLTSGFLLGIPVFFDTVFYLMIPLGKAMRMRTGRNYLLYVLTIVSGATMAHSLVPPTPGPLFVAEELGVDIGVMILGGCAIGFFTVVFGYFYARIAARIWDLPLRESPEFSTEDLEAITQREESDLPGFWLSLAPIVLPVILIGGNTVLQRFQDDLADGLVRTSAILGDKNIALGLSAAIALWTLVRQKKSNLKELGGAVQSSLAGGGVIILITAAGGAFGAVLQQTGVSGLIRNLPAASPPAIIGLAFLITTAIRTAQGSAT